MKSALDRGDSESRDDADDLLSNVKRDPADEPTASGTEPFVAGVDDRFDITSDLDDEVDEREKTIISQRPVAAPEEFYKAMPLADMAAMLEGKRLDHFQVEQIIGGGGMGAVFRGRDERLDRTVAIKVIPAAKRDPETLRRFRLEAQAAARLDHPNIARVYYVGESEQWNYIVFEFIDGVNVRDLVTMEGPLNVDDAVYYTRQIAEALYHAHERGVVHRDIKPSNILVTSGGTAKVVDMGLARNTALDRPTEDVTASGITLGTFDYISPEQARDPRDADVRSDLYSLGCSLFFMLTGHPPFPEGTALQKLLNHGSQPPPDPRGWRDDLSDQLYEIVMKLMAKQPGSRYQRPVDLINDLTLLAKIEELPRSQLPGTMLITPTVAQRSLLEANLPWMVAFAFLLGSALWLRSVQAISDGFPFPEPPSAPANNESRSQSETTEAQAVVADRAPQGQNLEDPPRGTPSVDSQFESEFPTASLDPDSAGANSAPAEAGSASPVQQDGMSQVTNGLPTETSAFGMNTAPIVVSEFRPADVEADRWENTIEQAIERLVTTDQRLEIELRGRVVLDSPLSIVGQALVLRGNPDTSPTIEIAPELFSELDDWSGVIQLRDSSLGINGIGFQTAPNGIIRQRKIGLFDIEGESELLVNSCSMTVAGASELSKSLYMFLVDERRLADRTYGNDYETANSNATITAVDTVFRGQASYVGLRLDQGIYNRVGMGLTNCLLALEGVAFDMARVVDSQNAVSRQVRLICRQSTFVTRAGFAVLDFGGPSAPLFSLNRTSDNCVFASPSSEAHVILRGPVSPGLLGDMPWLLMKGSDNAYDEGLLALAACEDRNGSITTTFGFNEAIQESWFDERGIERRIPWISKPSTTANLAQALLPDFGVRRDGFFLFGVEQSPDFAELE